MYNPSGDSGEYTFLSSASNGGKIHPSGEIQVASGADQTYILPEDPSVTIADFLVDSVSQGAITEYTFYNVSGEHTVHAEYNLNNKLAVDFSGEGSVYPPGNGYISGEESYSFYFVSAYEHEVSDVLVNGVSQGALQEYTFENVSSDQTLFINFSPCPVLKEHPPISIDDTFAEIQGEIVSLSGNSSLDVLFEWGLSGEYTNSTSAQNVSSSGEFISTSLSGLTSGEVYNYRLYATDGSGEWRSDPVFFEALRADVLNSVSTLSELNQGDTGDLVQAQDSLILQEQEVLPYGIKEEIQGGTCFDLGERAHTGTIELGYTSVKEDYIPVFTGTNLRVRFYSYSNDPEDEHGKLEFRIKDDYYRSSGYPEYFTDGGKHWLAIRWCVLEGAPSNFVEMFVDGNQIYFQDTSSWTYTSGEFSAWTTDLLLGSDFEGTDICNTRIWTDMRTPQEIQDNAWVKLNEEEHSDLFFSFWLDEGEGNYASSTSGRFLAYVDTPEESWITGLYSTTKKAQYISPALYLSGEIQCLDSLQQFMNPHRGSEDDTYFVVGESSVFSDCFYPLTPDMTSDFEPYGHSEPISTRSDADPTYIVFDGDLTTQEWDHPGTSTDFDVVFDFYNRVVAVRCDVVIPTSEAPKGLTVLASNDAENWTTLFSDSSVFSEADGGETVSIYFPNLNAYRFYDANLYGADTDYGQRATQVQFFSGLYSSSFDQIAQQGESLRSKYLFMIKTVSTTNTWLTPKVKWLFAGLRNSDTHDYVIATSRINAQYDVGRCIPVTKTAHLITATAGENGQVDPSGEIVGIEDQEIGFSFLPATDYVVENVTIDGSDQGNIDFYSLVVSSDHSLAATFKKPSIRVLTKDAENVSETGAVLNGYVEHLGSFNSGEVFFEWSYDLSLSNRTSGEVITTSGEFSGELTSLVPPAKVSFCACMLIELPDEGAAFKYQGQTHILTLTTDWEMTIETKEEFDKGTYSGEYSTIECDAFGALVLKSSTAIEHFDHGYSIDADVWEIPFNGSWEQIKNIDKSS